MKFLPRPRHVQHRIQLGLRDRPSARIGLCLTEGDSPTITFVLRAKGRTVREAALRRSRSERRVWMAPALQAFFAVLRWSVSTVVCPACLCGVYVSNRETNPALTKALQKGGVHIRPHMTAPLNVRFGENAAVRATAHY